MSDVKYEHDLQNAIPDLEVLKLRKENLALKRQLEEAQAILEENGLSEVAPKEIQPAEIICHQQIAKLAELSNKGLPFSMEEVKELEILVKTLLALQGKTVAEEKKPRKKDQNSVAELLSIVKNAPKE